MKRSSFSHAPARRQQRGAVLYVALMMLLLLALIGVAGMQVAGMQEKMASNYRATSRSFQNTEGAVRNAEAATEAVTNRTDPVAGSLVTSDAISQNCEDGFDPVKWGEDKAGQPAPAVNVRQIDQCADPASSIANGEANDKAGATFQITAYSADDPANPTSYSVIDTIFKL